MKKKLLIGAAVGSAGLVALTGATFAQTGGDSDGTTGNSMWDRVAEILGVAPDDLESAVEQAQAEERDAKLSEKLAAAVEEGVITQEEADSVTAWFAARPVFLDELGGIGAHGHIGLRLFCSADQLETALDRLITNEVITEEQAQEIRDWVAARPDEVLEKLLPGDGNHRGIQGRMFGRGPGGGLFEGRFHIRPYTPPADDGGDTGAESSGVGIGVSAVGA